MKHYPEKTAIKRNKPSAPMEFLKDSGYLKGQIMDFGCGKGMDADTYKMSKYDPYYFPVQLERYKDTYDTITCNYVLNVLPKDEEKKVLKNIQSLLTEEGKAYITVRRDIKKEGITSKKTFQRNVELRLPVVVEKARRFCIYLLTKQTKL